eukprot:NODE_1_length_95616_cov_0.657642.p36 type:complete len:307 gc:universal NODE_1_length_95616_cov_0.657642:32798-33718(+)
MEFCVSVVEESLFCEPSFSEICIGEDLSTGITRYVFKKGHVTGCVDIFESGYIVFENNKWIFHSSLNSSFAFKKVKRIITRVFTVSSADKYTFYLPYNYADLPNVYALELLQPELPSIHKSRKKRKVECWFCMSSAHFDKSLVTQVLNHFYITAAKGPMSISHGLIIPIEHIAVDQMDSNCRLELTLLLKHIESYFKASNLTFIFWISKKVLQADKLHDIISFMGLEHELFNKLPKLQLDEFKIDFERDKTECFFIDKNTLHTIRNFRYLDFVFHSAGVPMDWKDRRDEKSQRECIEFISKIPHLY